MRPRPHDPRRLDIAQAARDALQIEGRWPLAGFERLLEADVPSGGEVAWSATVALRTLPGGGSRPLLHLAARAEVTRLCQRCLEPVLLPLRIERDFVFLPDESSAAALDEASEDEDVLVLARSLDLHELIEDELLLALPLVPRHEDCAAPRSDAPAPAEAADVHPFAALASLKRPGRS